MPEMVFSTACRVLVGAMKKAYGTIAVTITIAVAVTIAITITVAVSLPVPVSVSIARVSVSVVPLVVAAPVAAAAFWFDRLPVVACGGRGRRGRRGLLEEPIDVWQLPIRHASCLGARAAAGTRRRRPHDAQFNTWPL